MARYVFNSDKKIERAYNVYAATKYVFESLPRTNRAINVDEVISNVNTEIIFKCAQKMIEWSVKNIIKRFYKENHNKINDTFNIRSFYSRHESKRIPYFFVSEESLQLFKEWCASLTVEETVKKSSSRKKTNKKNKVKQSQFVSVIDNSKNIKIYKNSFGKYFLQLGEKKGKEYKDLFELLKEKDKVEKFLIWQSFK
jgi:hypothetical protein